MQLDKDSKLNNENNGEEKSPVSSAEIPAEENNSQQSVDVQQTKESDTIESNKNITDDNVTSDSSESKLLENQNKNGELQQSQNVNESVEQSNIINSEQQETEEKEVDSSKLENLFSKKEDNSNNPESNQNNSSKTQKISLAELQKAKDEINKEKELVDAINEAEKKGDYEEKNRLKKQLNEARNLPPEQSLADDVLDEELEKYLYEEKKAQEEALLKAEEESYEGLTEEEIKEAKERKLKFIELQRRYNTKDNVNPKDMGDYQKILDFSTARNLKKFKVKPPKALFKILACVFAFLVVALGISCYFILNKPEEAILLNKLSLSQDKTYQKTGEKLDLRGLYLYCEYSNGSTKTLKVTEKLISKTSPNIDEGLIITSGGEQSTYVYFMVENKEIKLDVDVQNYSYKSVSAKLFKDKVSKGDLILFEEILIIAKTSDEREKRIEPKTCTFKMNNNELTKTETGFYIPEDISGNQILSIIILDNTLQQYLTFINFVIE